MRRGVKERNKNIRKEKRKKYKYECMIYSILFLFKAGNGTII